MKWKLYQPEKDCCGARHDCGNSPSSSFVMSPITEAQMSRLFFSLNVKKSTLDVSNKLINKNCWRAIIEALSTHT